MNVIYNKKSGIIESAISLDQNYKVYYSEFGQSFIDSIDVIHVDNLPSDLLSYKVINNELVKMSEVEHMEMMKYGRFLTDEERLLNKLKPTIEEIQKAEQTIEILTLIQEVM